MRRLWLATATLLLWASPAGAQTSPMPTPVFSCTDRLPAMPPPILAQTPPARGAAGQPSLTAISISGDDDRTRYFVMDREVTIDALGEALRAAWHQNSAGNSAEACSNPDNPPQLRFPLGNRSATVCRIVVRADPGLRYGEVLQVLNELQRRGFRQVALTAPGQSFVFFTNQLPLNPVAMRFEGMNPTVVSIVMSSSSGSLVVGVETSRGLDTSSIADLGQQVWRHALQNNPALDQDSIYSDARVCVRPDHSISYGDVLSVLSALSHEGFVKLELVPDVAEVGPRR